MLYTLDFRSCFTDRDARLLEEAKEAPRGPAKIQKYNEVLNAINFHVFDKLKNGRSEEIRGEETDFIRDAFNGYAVDRIYELPYTGMRIALSRVASTLSKLRIIQLTFLSARNLEYVFTSNQIWVLICGLLFNRWPNLSSKYLHSSIADGILSLLPGIHEENEIMAYHEILFNCLRVTDVRDENTWADVFALISIHTYWNNSVLSSGETLLWAILRMLRKSRRMRVDLPQELLTQIDDFIDKNYYLTNVSEKHKRERERKLATLETNKKVRGEYGEKGIKTTHGETTKLDFDLIGWDFLFWLGRNINSIAHFTFPSFVREIYDENEKEMKLASEKRIVTYNIVQLYTLQLATSHMEMVWDCKVTPFGLTLTPDVLRNDLIKVYHLRFQLMSAIIASMSGRVGQKYIEIKDHARLLMMKSRKILSKLEELYNYHFEEIHPIHPSARNIAELGNQFA